MLSARSWEVRRRRQAGILYASSPNWLWCSSADCFRFCVLKCGTSSTRSHPGQRRVGGADNRRQRLQHHLTSAAVPPTLSWDAARPSQHFPPRPGLLTATRPIYRLPPFHKAILLPRHCPGIPGSPVFLCVPCWGVCILTRKRPPPWQLAAVLLNGTQAQALSAPLLLSHGLISQKLPK